MGKSIAEVNKQRKRKVTYEEDGFATPLEVKQYQHGEVRIYRHSYVAHCVECGNWYRKRKTLRSAIATLNGHYQMNSLHLGRGAEFFE